MSYTVDNRREAEKLLDKFEKQGYDATEDIRRANGSRKQRVGETGGAENLALAADGTPGQFSAEYVALYKVRNDLVAQIGVLDRLIADARELGRPMKDGHGPIAFAIRRTFEERVNDRDGALHALKAYRKELRQVVQALERTLAQYQNIDSEVAQHLTTLGEHHG